ncbi:SPOR domain-containing protein [Duganella sp. FT27W]|uniref:SPOR domain-containing protein n=1 Tax=Duganella sp. FT27W TaxID=2654636 RepID=UPI00135DD383|nr:SPOR domain-containing protein [Duganella sp. FT27W]
MLKFIFCSLLAVNAALFAYGQGYLGHFSGNEREPQRLQRQLNPKDLTLVSSERAHRTEASAPAVAANAATDTDTDAATATAAGATPAAKPAPPLACVEIGSFVLAEARRFEARLAPLQLGDRQSRRNLPGTEVSSYIVHIPPQGSKEAADRKAAELRGLGVTNYYVISDNSPLRYGVSLGVFKTEGAAQNQLAMLVKQGVRTARVTPRMSGSRLLAFQFRDVAPSLKADLDKIRADFPNTDVRTCR